VPLPLAVVATSDSAESLLLEGALRQQGFAPLIAMTPLELVRLIVRDQPRLVVLGRHIHGATREQLMTLMAEECPDVTCVSAETPLFGGTVARLSSQ
jgi:hypothetical protein